MPVNSVIQRDTASTYLRVHEKEVHLQEREEPVNHRMHKDDVAQAFRALHHRMHRHLQTIKYKSRQAEHCDKRLRFRTPFSV